VDSVASISSGVALLYYLYEVAEAIDLPALEKLVGTESSKRRLAFKYGTPAYLQFQNAPLVIAGEPLTWREREYQCRIKFYDYGVLSVTLQTHFSGSWQEFIALSAEVISDPDLEAAVSGAVSRRLESLQAALVKPLAVRMTEDYAIFGVQQESEQLTGLEMSRRHGPEIAQILRGDASPLSEAEIAEVMASPLSYYPRDLLVAGWNAAFIYDDPAGLEATAEIFEFANSQLLEYRYYDEILSVELSAVYDEMEKRHASGYLFRSYGYRRTARRLNAMYVDISELTEKSENSLKFFGDLFASRVYRLAAQKLGVNEWKTLVGDKLQTANILYRSMIDEVGAFRMEFMEAVIVIILVVELALSLLGKG